MSRRLVGLLLAGIVCRAPAWADTSEKVDILGMTIVKNEPDQLLLNIEIENRQDEPATVICMDTFQGAATAFYMSSNNPIKKGKGVYPAEIGLNPSAAPERHDSDGLLCEVIPVKNYIPARILAEKRFPLKKSWVWSPPNKISDIRIVDDKGEKIDVDVDYTYSGDHGNENIYIDCFAYTDNWFTPFAMLPAPAVVGTHTARAEMSSFEATPANIVSTKIRCGLNTHTDPHDFADKAIAFRKVWKPH